MTSRRPARAFVVLAAGAIVLAGCTSAPAATSTPSHGVTSSAAPTTASATIGSRSVAPSSSSSRVSVPTAKPTSSSARPVPPTSTVAERPAPQAFVTPADVLAARRAVAAMSTSEQAGSVIMANSTGVLGTDQVRTLHLGGVILMGSNGIVDGTRSGTPDQVAAVTAAVQAGRGGGPPVLIGTDQEYGDVTRLVHGFTEFPGASRLARIADTGQAVDLTERTAAAAAAEMLAVGVTVNFAPDADLLPRSGESAIGSRSYGTDPQRVGQLVAAAVRGYQRAGLPATLKHFPGIGAAAADTHVDLPTLSTSCARWNERDSTPMAAGVKAGAALVMTGHVLLPAAGSDRTPTSLDPAVATDLLRSPGRNGCRGLGFTGIAVTDSMQMAPIADVYSSGEAAAKALAAGQDLLLMPMNPAAAVRGIEAAVGNGTLSKQRLAEAATRVYALRLAVARTPRPDLSVINSDEHRDLAAAAFNAG